MVGQLFTEVYLAHKSIQVSWNGNSLRCQCLISLCILLKWILCLWINLTTSAWGFNLVIKLSVCSKRYEHEIRRFTVVSAYLLSWHFECLFCSIMWLNSKRTRGTYCLYLTAEATHAQVQLNCELTSNVNTVVSTFCLKCSVINGLN